ncbi:MAG: hypothetical protein IKC24_05830 [Oscillospiraceae bacterium]|nr:hypothetical protein [Oscillospiraceae bacterium]
MGKKNTPILAAITVLTVLIVVLLALNSVRRSAHIHLPEADVQQGTESGNMDGSAIHQIMVKPDTVQSVIATLQRSDQYSRSVTVEQIWSGGSGISSSDIYVMGGWTRVDTHGTDGSVRHSLTDGEKTYIWYDDETTYFSGAAGSFSADNEQSIPTYEDILAVAQEEIFAADYRSYSGTDCIYVETRVSAQTKLCWWVSVSTGLLTAAEKYEGDLLVYRMSAAESSDSVLADYFVLPDGTALHQGS